ncbi:isochorismatase family protein [Erythrobacter sp. JK5]|uniref:isochorismatase family protein n=1 Tax=Erythrobacter sp. JK5 TaxID=2829500 RepID=UPI001BA73AAA|nr:isochorismatase family protein [Erythrobacter sp. JK5]QUL39447.1 isochorismatase family protein [Erythrobacter sp. JK5]
MRAASGADPDRFRRGVFRQGQPALRRCRTRARRRAGAARSGACGGSAGDLHQRRVPSLDGRWRAVRPEDRRADQFRARQSDGRVAPGLEPREDELVISKQYASAFFGTSLASTLTANGHDSLIITGLSTSGCVRATCVDACQHGFIPIVVEEAVGDRHADVHRANLFDMNAKYGDVVGKAEVLEHLAALAGA